MRMNCRANGSAALRVWFCGFVAASVLAGLGPPAFGQDGDALVIVNGRPIARQQVMDLLLEAHGLAIMQQLIVLELARAETQARGLSVSGADIDAELNDALQKLVAGAAPGAALSEQAKRQALERVLEDKGLSMAEFMIGMERNAHLRKIVEGELTIADDDLRVEFGRVYGARLRARQIVLRDATGVREALAALAANEDFAAVARRLSSDPLSAAAGGELPPFTSDDAEVPAAVREAAFGLADGTVSPAIRSDDRYYIVKVESRIPPENVRFEDVREALTASVKSRMLPKRMSGLASELFRKANIRVLHPKLREQYEALRKRSAEAGGGP